MTFTVIIVQGAGVGIAVEQIDTVSFHCDCFAIPSNDIYNKANSDLKLISY